jgi:hypothetical protein
MFPVDRVAQYITTTGTTENQELGAAVTSYRTADSLIVDFGLGSPIIAGYLIKVTDGSAFELGIGEFQETFFYRRHVIHSSNSDARINIPTETTEVKTIVYIVNIAMNAVAASITDEQFSGTYPVEQGPMVAPYEGDGDRVFGAAAIGAMAVAWRSQSLALGAMAQANQPGAIALGYATNAYVPYAMSVCGSNYGSAVTMGMSDSFSDVGPHLMFGRGSGFKIPANSAYKIEVDVVAKRVSPSLAIYSAKLKGTVYRSGSAMPVFVAAAVKSDEVQSAGVTCDCDMYVDETEETVIVEVTNNASGESWNWSVVLRTIEVIT